MRTALLLSLLAVTLAACQREARRFEEPAAATMNTRSVKPEDLAPGGTVQRARIEGNYLENAYAISQGKQLFIWYNCNGCHNRGGGGIGPPLMDDKWIYGGAPENIYQTIVDGRPNGMPAFRGRVPSNQVWQLVAYVRSMSGLAPPAAAPGRDDTMQLVSPEQTRDPKQPKQDKGR